jgi:hypothetical protein
VLGEVDHEAVVPLLQFGQQGPFRLELGQGAEFFPIPVNGMDLADGRMQGQHLGRVLVHQGIDFQVGGVVLQHREYRRGEQHVAVVAQFDDQHPADGLQVDGVFEHGAKQ